MTALRIGGPLAIRCDTCRQPQGADCVLLSGPDGRPVPWPRRRPHACRVKAAPPEAEAKAGDLVIVRIGPREALAVVGGGTQDAVALRFWSDARGWSDGWSHLEAWRLGLAPEDERTAAARAALT